MPFKSTSWIPKLTTEDPSLTSTMNDRGILFVPEGHSDVLTLSFNPTLSSWTSWLASKLELGLVKCDAVQLVSPREDQSMGARGPLVADK